MNRLKLRNTFLKTKKKEPKRRFNRQKKFCVSQKNFMPSMAKTKRSFFGETRSYSCLRE